VRKDAIIISRWPGTGNLIGNQASCQKRGSGKSDHTNCGTSKVLMKRIAVIFLVIGMSQPAWAQFVVQPMQVVVTPRPGSRYSGELVLENQSPTEPHTVTLSVDELVQDDQGFWTALDANDLQNPQNADKLSGRASCREWITLKDEVVQVPPYGNLHIPYRIVVPAGVRGFYCAAIRARLLPRPGLSGVVVRYNFVVPILLTIEGPALRHQIELDDADLVYVKGERNIPSQVLVQLSVKNEGASFGNLVATARVRQVLSNDKTRLIASEVPFDNVGIIPGSELHLQADLRKKLPSGKYLVSGSLFVDGRRVKGIRKEVEFVNPEYNGIVHTDTAITFDQSFVDIATSPGRAGDSLVTLSNNSDERVTVKAYVTGPEGLESKVGRGIRGAQLSCADWIEVIPAQFPLRAIGRRNVRIVARMPGKDKMAQSDVQFSSYYANVKFYAFSSDGSNAGTADMLVCLSREDMEPDYLLRQQELKLEQLGASKFVCATLVTNLGFTHVVPKCIAYLKAQGSSADSYLLWTELESEGSKSYMLPFEKRNFSGEFDFSNVEPGMYRIEAEYEYAPGKKTAFGKNIEVYAQGDQKMVQTLNTALQAANRGGLSGK